MIEFFAIAMTILGPFLPVILSLLFDSPYLLILGDFAAAFADLLR